MPTIVGLDMVTIAFAAFNLLRLVSYLPQIVAVALDRNGARTISFSCWSIWVGANASTAAYAWERLEDANLALVSTFNTVCCITVLLITVYKRYSSVMSAPSHAAGRALGGSLRTAPGE